MFQPEFTHLRNRQEKQFKYLAEVREQIDLRISDDDIMVGCDYGLDMVSVAKEFINKLDKR